MENAIAACFLSMWLLVCQLVVKKKIVPCAHACISQLDFGATLVVLSIPRVFGLFMYMVFTVLPL